MYDTLKAISIRLDTTSQSLTKDAIAQVLIKIIYNSDISLSRNQILDAYKNIVKCDDAKRADLLDILEALVKNGDVQVNKGQFYLSTNKRQTISSLKDESERRFKYVIETYFSPTYSSFEEVQDWLQDSLVIFFSYYSKEWIADLCYNQNAVLQNIEQVIDQISLRTRNNKNIRREDKDNLISNFRKILTEKDPQIASLMWEYGTSQFSAQLIKNGANIDKLTVDTFSGATCLVDTNILIYLALEGTEYTKHLKAIERIFHSLGISVRYLHITKTEYENTIGTKADEILKIVESYPSEILEEADNQLLKSALHLRCKTLEDFQRFFKQILAIPSVIDKTVRVSLLDDDRELENAINEAQNNDKRRNDLNSAYRSFTHRDKREHALLHDVGMIAATDHLRHGGKFFILTQDSSIINYAKQYPFLNGLPLAIKIETLLNVLAVNSYNNSCENYVPLFATLIREGLQPRNNTFKVEDLHYVLDKEQFISQLPAESVRAIVSEVSQRRLLGESDEVICKELDRKVQSEKFKVARDLDSAKLLLSSTQSQKKKADEENLKGKKALIKKWKAEKEKEISSKCNCLYWRLLWLPGLIIAITCGILFLSNNYRELTIPLWGKIATAILLDIAISLWAILKGVLPKITSLKKNKHSIIEDYVNEKLKETYE